MAEPGTLHMLIEKQINVPDSLAPGYMSAPGIRDFYARTSALMQGRHPARFADLDLMSMHRLAPDVMIIDVDPATCRKLLRFVGTRIVDVFGQETTGMYLDQIDIGPFRSQQLAAFNMAVAAKRPQWTRVNALLANDHTPLHRALGGMTYERLVVPFTDKSGQVTHLAAMTACTETANADNRFEHREVDLGLN
ncbi:MAG: hypothetical protein WD075_09575 [Rhodospirillales bacterium]